MSAAFALGNLAGVIEIGTEDSVLTAELQAGSEEAFSLLIAEYHAPVFSLVSRLLKDPSDAPDITQDVFIKVFRGIRNFHGDSSLRTWIYRIALHEASNQRRWWSRHRGREVTIELETEPTGEHQGFCLKDRLIDQHESPFELAVHEEIRAKVESELRNLPEPFRAVVVLRDLEGMAYDEIAEVLGTQLGTIKSRLVRGRAMLRQRLESFIERSQGHSGSAPIKHASASSASVRRTTFEEAI
ncbi:MAG TPA: sigma-70 family RNA polymerase sigma factor [Acidobacteriaceae bacterium]|nr:sigma-70 family RNA polymerase sigma factor [Acidobacteriaceae bacterium]